MKKLIGTLFFGASALIIIYGVRQFFVFYHSQYKLVKAKINDISLRVIDLVLILQITNKSDISVKINNQFYEVFLNEVKVSEIKLDDLLHISSNNNTILNIPVKINYDRILNVVQTNVLNLLTDKSKIRIEVRGHLSLNVGPVSMSNYPIDVKITLQDIINLAKKPKEVDA